MSKILDGFQNMITPLRAYCRLPTSSKAAKNTLAYAEDLLSALTEKYNNLLISALAAGDDETEKALTESIEIDFSKNHGQQITNCIASIQAALNPTPTAPPLTDEQQHDAPPDYQVAQQNLAKTTLNVTPFETLNRLIFKCDPKDKTLFEPLYKDYVHRYNDLMRNLSTAKDPGQKYTMQAAELLNEVANLIELLQLQQNKPSFKPDPPPKPYTLDY